MNARTRSTPAFLESASQHSVPATDILTALVSSSLDCLSPMAGFNLFDFVGVCLGRSFFVNLTREAIVSHV